MLGIKLDYFVLIVIFSSLSSRLHILLFYQILVMLMIKIYLYCLDCFLLNCIVFRICCHN